MDPAVIASIVAGACGCASLIVQKILDMKCVKNENFDGSVNVLDVVAIMGFIIESISPPTSSEFQAADVNQDFSIDVLDVVMVVSSILGS